jgi:hypothetical protein
MSKYAKVNVFTKKVEETIELLPPNPESNLVKISDSDVNVNVIERGYTYDVDNDRFLAVKPYSDWVLDTSTLSYKPPVDKPSSGTPAYGSRWRWNQDSQQWE